MIDINFFIVGFKGSFTIGRNKINRRSFIQSSSLATGGFLLSFSWLAGCKLTEEERLQLPKEWFELNSYIKIGENGVTTLYSPNPEFGQNIKTALPMLIAEELDLDWKQIIFEQGNFNPIKFDRQFTGGSQGVRNAWTPLRTAGATARRMLINAATQSWNVEASSITTADGVLLHPPSGKKASYGAMASLASTLEVPAEVPLKDPKDFKIIGQSKSNVENDTIITGKPLFSIDHYAEGMLTAMIVHPPAFGMQLKSFDKSSVINMHGIVDVFEIEVYKADFNRNFFDTISFPKKSSSHWKINMGSITSQECNQSKLGAYA